MRIIAALSFLVAAATGACAAHGGGQRRLPPAPALGCFCPVPTAAARASSSSRVRRIIPALPLGFDLIHTALIRDDRTPTCAYANGRTLLRSERLAAVEVESGGGADEEDEEGNDSDDDGRRLSDAPPSKRDIVVSSSIDLPFPAEVAFDAFSDLPRQPTWSPWLRSVEYVDDDGGNDDEKSSSSATPICEVGGVPLREARWTMGYRGLRFSWNAVSTALERPNRIDWESTSGLKNYGTVTFVEVEEGRSSSDVLDGSVAGTTTRMTLSMKFRAPRVVASLLRRSDKIAALMEEKMLRKTLHLFREVVMAEDMNVSADGQLHLEESNR